VRWRKYWLSLVARSELKRNSKDVAVVARAGDASIERLTSIDKPQAAESSLLMSGS
jgi:hypothetical protein